MSARAAPDDLAAEVDWAATHVIYLVVCGVTGKQYVGQTTMSLRARWARHCWESTRKRSAQAITRAIAKYGKEAFVLRILERCSDMETLNEAEQRWIQNLGTLSPGGYNLNTGGGNAPMSDATRAAIAAANLGRVASAESRARMSAAQRGKKLPPEQVARMREQMTGKPLSALARQTSLAAVQIAGEVTDPQGHVHTFVGLKAFCKEQGLGYPSMSELVAGHRPQVRGWTCPSAAQQTTSHPCEGCGTLFERYRYQRGTYCSRSCRVRASRPAGHPSRTQARGPVRVPLDVAAVAALYRSGLTLAEVGRQVGVSEATVLSRLRGAGEPIRARGERVLVRGLL